jgi:trypsin
MGFTSVFALASPVETTPHIVGGNPATAGEFPYIASLQDYDTGHYCGGSLIGKHWVLTAAHCISDVGAPDQIVMGILNVQTLAGAETFTTKKAFIHPQHNSTTHDFDYALLELDHDATTAPVSLNANTAIEQTQVMATVAGWGALSESSYTDSNILMTVDVPLVTDQNCQAAYPNQITANMLCAGYPQGGKDACGGDSGGPLVIKSTQGQDVLVGVVSWGIGCAEPKQYGIYSDVAAALSWINTTMATAP